MSRLRRLVPSDRFFFVTCRVLRHRRMLEEPEFECLAQGVRGRRDKQRFLLTAGLSCRCAGTFDCDRFKLKTC